jgi:ribA/ribD-fused uncharacterized protein
MNGPRVINFYRTGDPFGEFSNFADFRIHLKDREWPTTEHYFQAQKFAGTRHEEAVRLATSPAAAAKMGRERRRPLRRDWESVKDDIMREAVLAKFEQHPDLRSLLLSTGDADIVEHTRNDSYWGDGGDGSRLNMLGRILVETRERMRTAQTFSGSSMQESTHAEQGPAPAVSTAPTGPLDSCAGRWRGINRLYVDPQGPPDESESGLIITRVLEGSFVRIDQTWAFEGKPQEGSLLVGFDADAKQVSIHWIDTFHMGRKVMACTGSARPEGGIDVLGSYAAPPGLDWGWRIRIISPASDRLEIRMFNISPETNEALAVLATHQRE